MFLCGPQALAHVEAFIDFSEDELIEEGVLNQGTYFLPSCVGKMRTHSGSFRSQGGGGGVSGWFSCLDLGLASERSPL